MPLSPTKFSDTQDVHEEPDVRDRGWTEPGSHGAAADILGEFARQ